MISARHFALASALILCAFAATARAQSPSIEIATDAEMFEVTGQGKSTDLRIEVFAPSGELVFETVDSGGQSIRWPMVNQRGERVPDGVYLATITVVDSTGRRRKRIEQITVSTPRYEAQPSTAPQAAGTSQAGTTPAPNAAGAGTAGRIAKWVDNAGTLDDSIMTESAGRVGVNAPAPVATLHVFGLQPAPQADTGTKAALLLQVAGGKGGNTTVGGGKVAGAGADIALYGGQGGDAPSGSKRGNGGSITLQPGSTGAGAGAAGASGNVLLAPNGVGSVAIGTNAPAVPGLHIGAKVPGGQARLRLDNSNGQFGGLNRWTNRLELMSSDAIGFSTGGVASPDMWISTEGNIIIGSHSTSPTNKLYVVATDVGNAVYGLGAHTGLYGDGGAFGVYGYTDNDFGGIGVSGRNPNHGAGVAGSSDVGSGVSGSSKTGTGVRGDSESGYAGSFHGKGRFTGDLEVGGNQSFGQQTRQMLNLWGTNYGIGVQDSTLYFRTDFNFSWFHRGTHSNTLRDPGSGGTELMLLSDTGNLFIRGAYSHLSDRNAKHNFAAVSPREVLERVARLPIGTWSYKTDKGGVRHMGPVAQDFHREFGLGFDDKHITTVDADGVMMASIQALYQMMKEKDRKNEQLALKVEHQSRQIERLQAQLNLMRRAVRRGRAAKR